jgi:oxygen-dependent protoporphyrinogen oxidase
MMKHTIKKIAVVGGGISGLCVAYYLKKAGLEAEVFEQNNYVGGSLVTEKENGFLADLGPNSILETSLKLRQLIDELGLEKEKIYANSVSNNRFIVKKGKLQALPLSPPAFLKSQLFSWKAKFRLLREPFLPPVKVEDISLGDYVRYRLGEEFLDYAINPFVAGVYAGDPEKLSAPAAFPKLFALEQKYGSFIKGAIKGSRERKKRQEIAKDRAKIFSFVNGMQILPQTLARYLGRSICYSAKIEALSPANKGFLLVINNQGAVQKRQFHQVILAVPTYVQAELLKPLIKEKAEMLAQVEYPPVAVVFMGFNQADVRHDLNGFGFLVPAVEKRGTLGTIFSSTLFPQRAPRGKVALTTFVGGTRNPQNALQDDGELEKIVFEDLKALLGVQAKPVYTKIRRWPKAIPQYTLGYKKVQALFDHLEQEFPGLYFTGNFRRGISIGDSVLCAEETAKKIITGIIPG